MNKDRIVPITVAAVGMVSAFIGGYFLGKKKAEKKAAAQFDEYAEQLRADYKRKTDALKNDGAPETPIQETVVPEAPVEPYMPPVPPVVNESMPTMGPAEKVLSAINAGVSIDKICETFNLSPVVVRRIAYDYTHSTPTDEGDCPTNPVDYDPIGNDVVLDEIYNQQSPYLIDQTEYGNVQSRAWQTERLFYRGNATLVDTNSNKVDIIRYIGQDAVNKLNETAEDVCVRNDILKKDFYVIYAVDDVDDFMTPRNAGSTHGDFNEQ